MVRGMRSGRDFCELPAPRAYSFLAYTLQGQSIPSRFKKNFNRRHPNA